MVVLIWLSISLCVVTIAGFFYYFHQVKKDRTLTNFSKRNYLFFGGFIFAFTIFSIICAIAIKLKNNYQMSGGYITSLIFGTIFFAVSFMGLLETFVIYFYKTNLNQTLRKRIYIAMFTFIPVLIIGLIMCLDAYATYQDFPLYCGICFSSSGVKFVKPNDVMDGFTIRWYGIVILAGALIAYFVSDHHFYKEYKRHGLIDTLFILVFLVGIFGARIWAVYVLPSESGVAFWDFQRGGLGIMGGVIFGGLAGIIFLAIFRRYINIRHAIDLILPCVLIAQAVGRWGNYFNQEVYGAAIDVNVISWLPTFIWKNMYIAGAYRVPLFFIEMMMNLAGYFIIQYAIGRGLKKHLSYGDLFCLYFVWYGITRIVLEPLRDQTFYNLESIITSWSMFGVGIAGIIGLHLYDYFRWGKHTFIIVDNERLHHPKNPYFIKEEIKHEKP